MSVLAQIEDLDTLVHIRVVGRAVPLDVPLAALLLVPPLRAHALVEAFLDPPIQLIDIHGVDALLESIPLRLKPGDRVIVFALLVGAALTEGADDPLEDLLVDPQAREVLGELLLQDLLADIWLAAFSLEAGAVIVDVLALLDLGDQGAAAMGALDEAGEGDTPRARQAFRISPGRFTADNEAERISKLIIEAALELRRMAA